MKDLKIWVIYIILINRIKNIFRIDNENTQNNNHLILNFTTKVKGLRKIEKGTYNKSQFISEFLNNYIFIEVSIGVPSQQVSTMIDPYEKCFTIKYEESIENLTKFYYLQDKIIELKSYQKEGYKNVKDHGIIFIDEFYEYDRIYHLEDLFMFINEDKDSLSHTVQLNFFYGMFNEDNENEKAYGKIGLSLDSYGNKDCPSFIKEIKKSNVIDKFTFSLKFINDNKGKNIFWAGASCL